MAREERKHDVYWTRVLERLDTGVRREVERHVFESVAGANKKFEELCLKYNKAPYIVDILFIFDSQFHTIKEKRMVDTNK